jgi:hypothetical protein
MAQVQKHCICVQVVKLGALLDDWRVISKHMGFYSRANSRHLIKFEA